MEKMYRVPEVAKAAGVHPNMVWRALWKGTIPHYKLNDAKKGAVRISGPDAREFLKARGRAWLAPYFKQEMVIEGDEITMVEAGEILALANEQTVRILLADVVTTGEKHIIKGPGIVKVVKKDVLNEWIANRRRVGTNRSVEHESA